MDLATLISVNNNPQEHTRLCVALYEAEHGLDYQAIDDNRGDGGNDGYITSQKRMIARHCFKVRPKVALDDEILKKLKGDLKKVVALKKSDAYDIENWTFQTNYPVSNDVVKQAIALGKAEGISVSIKTETYLAVLLSKHKHLLPQFPQYQLPELQPQLDEMNAKLDKITNSTAGKDASSDDSIQEIDSDSLQSRSEPEKNSKKLLSTELSNDTADLGSAILTAAVNEEYHEELDHAKDLLDKHKYTEGLKYLEKLKTRIWKKANKNIRFRLLTNIASAQYHLEQVDEAAKNFLDAYNISPTEEKARSNRAFAYLLQLDYPKAINAADEIIKDEPLHETAHAVRIQAQGHAGKPFETILGGVPKELLETQQVAYALANAAKKLGLQKESSKWLEIALSTEETDPYAMSYLAGNMVEEVIEANAMGIRGHLAGRHQERLTQAIDLFKKAWKLIPDREDKKHATEILFNLSTAYRLLGDLEKAQAVHDELLELSPDEKNYKIAAAAIAYDRKDFSRVKDIMTQLAEDSNVNPEALIRLAEAHSKLNDDESATKVLVAFLNTYKQTDRLWEDASYLLFDIHINNNRLDEAAQIAENVDKQGAAPLMAAILKARICRLQGDSDKANTMLEQAESLIDPSTINEWVIEYAQEAYNLKNYKLAIKAYEMVVDTEVDTILTRRYLHSLYEAKQYQRVIEIAEGLRKAGGAVRDITQFEWAAYQELQDLPHAQEILTAYIDSNSDDEDAKLRLALMKLRSGDMKSVDEYLKGTVDLSKVDFFSGVQLANLYQLRGQSDKTLKIIYELRRIHANDPDAHSAYVSIFLGLEDAKLSANLHPKEVNAGTVIIYDGGWFVIEEDFEPNVSMNEITPEDATKRGYIGKKKGDEIVISENQIAGQVKAKITEIQSKYVYAFQETLRTYEKRFPDRSDLMGVSFEGENIDPLLKQLDQQHDHIQNIEKLYNEGKITIDLFSKLAKKDYLAVFYGLRSIPDLGIRAATGTDEERVAADDVLLDEPVLVADISALVTLFELGVTVRKIGIKKLTIAQATKDLIQEEILKFEGANMKVSMTMYKRGGKYYRDEVSAKDQRARINRIKRFAKWVNANTVTNSVTQKQLDNFEAKQKNLSEIMGNAQIETLKLAIGEGFALYCDDVGLKGIAKSGFDIDGVWTQALLAYQAGEGAIDDEVYADLVIKLTQANYHHTGVNQAILMRAAEQAGWMPKEPFTPTLRAITRKETTMQSLIIVVVNFLYELYKKPVPVEKTYLIQQVLTEVAKNHDMEVFLAGLNRAIEIRFRLTPNFASEINETINIWRTMRGL
jgi:tetratricopeptide (TPR) repeat protein